MRKALFGIGPCMALFVVLFVMKTVGAIECSWAVVFAPLWMPIAVGIAIGFIGLILCTLVVTMGEEWHND